MPGKHRTVQCTSDNPFQERKAKLWCHSCHTAKLIIIIIRCPSSVYIIKNTGHKRVTVQTAQQQQGLSLVRHLALFLFVWASFRVGAICSFVRHFIPFCGTKLLCTERARVRYTMQSNGIATKQICSNSEKTNGGSRAPRGAPIAPIQEIDQRFDSISTATCIFWLLRLKLKAIATTNKLFARFDCIGFYWSSLSGNVQLIPEILND